MLTSTVMYHFLALLQFLGLSLSSGAYVMYIGSLEFGFFRTHSRASFSFRKRCDSALERPPEVLLRAVFPSRL